MVVMTIGIMGIGVLPYYVHKLQYGVVRPVAQDGFDHQMRVRGWRLEAEATKAAKEAAAAAAASSE